MTANSSFDRDLERWLEAEAPAMGPAGMHAAVIDRARARRQRPAWLVGVRGGAFGSARTLGRPTARVAFLLAVLGLLVAALLAALAGSAARPAPGPRLTAGGFIRPFEYVLPHASTIRQTSEDFSLLAFTEGSDENSPDKIYPNDPDGKILPGVRGITVSATDQAVTHPCPMVDGEASRVPIRAQSQAFLSDLRTIAGIGLGESMPTTIDGRPGLAVGVDPRAGRCDYGDFHVRTGGLGGYVLLNLPSRLSLVEVDGKTVVIQVWAGTEPDLAAWLPTAREFVDSIHFIPNP